MKPREPLSHTKHHFEKPKLFVFAYQKMLSISFVKLCLVAAAIFAPASSAGVNASEDSYLPSDPSCQGPLNISFVRTIEPFLCEGMKIDILAYICFLTPSSDVRRISHAERHLCGHQRGSSDCPIWCVASVHWGPL